MHFETWKADAHVFLVGNVNKITNKFLQKKLLVI